MNRTLPVKMLATVGVLEFCSGLPYGLINDLVPVWLKESGASLVMIGAATGLTMPWNLKPLWGPIVDRFGNFRSWTVLAVLAIAILVALVPYAGEQVIPLLLTIALLGGVQDVALDGWIVAVVPADQQGRAASMRTAAFRAAMALGGGGAVWVGARYGWEFGWSVVAAFGLLGCAAVTRLPTPPRRVPAPPAAFVATFARWIAEPGVLGAIAFGIIYKLGDAAMAPMVRPFWIDHGLSAEEVGLLSTLAGSLLTASGAVVGGEVTNRIGLGRAALILGSGQLTSNLVYAVVALAPSRGLVIGAGMFESFTAGLGTAPLMVLLMRAAGKEQTATRWAVLSALIGFSRTVSGTVSGFGTVYFGYASWFGLTALLALPALAMAPFVVRRLPEATRGPG